jgi:hypothetical protein
MRGRTKGMMIRLLMLMTLCRLIKNKNRNKQTNKKKQSKDQISCFDLKRGD